MVIIGLGHRKRMGKDTFAKILKKTLKEKYPDKKIKIVGFADNVKIVCQKLYGWAGLKDKAYYNSPEHEHERETVIPRLGLSPRQIWEKMGTDVARNIWTDTWVELLLNDTKADILIIPDTRFPNEVEKIRKYNGRVIKIVRPGIPHINNHVEGALADFNDWDYTVNNNGKKKCLHKEANKIIDMFFSNL